jgi:hypothetical protein
MDKEKLDHLKVHIKWKETTENNVFTIKHRIHLHNGVPTMSTKEFFAMRFVDEAHAIAFAKKHIHDLQFDKERKLDDQDFMIQEEDDSNACAQVMDCLVLLATYAKKHHAVLLIPDYMTMSSNSKLIETALDYVEFDGPVINVTTEGQAACDAESAEQTYNVNGREFPKGIIHNRATHSIQVRNGSYSRVAARLADVIAHPDLGLFDTDGRRKTDSEHEKHQNKVVFVIAGGGMVVMEHMAQAVEENIPIVLLKGSKRLCDFLPDLWVRRFSSQFDLLKETHKFCVDLGFPDPKLDPDSKMNLWMRFIVERGHVNIHQLSSCTHSLRRILQSLHAKDDALLQAMRRYCDYRSAASNMEGPDFRMLVAKLILGFSTTLFSTLAGALLPDGLLKKIIHFEVKLGENSLPVVLLCVCILTLPCILSIIMALHQDYNYAPKILALRYAAALVEREMFRYRACSTYYSDDKIAAAAALPPSKGDSASNYSNGIQDTSTKGDSEAGKPEVQDYDGNKPKFQNKIQSLFETQAIQSIRDWMTRTGVNTSENFDIQSIRARRLTDELITIGDQVPIFDCPDIDHDDEVNEFIRLFQPSRENRSKNAKTKVLGVHQIRNTISKMKLLSGVKEVAHHTLEDLDSEIKFGQLSGEDYAVVRLDVHLGLFEEEADSLDWMLLFYKVATYSIGAVSGFLSYLGLEVREPTA